MADKNWNLELSEYIRQGEPEKIDKNYAWRIKVPIRKTQSAKMTL